MKIHRLIFSPIEVNTYILADENGDCAIIDCGCYTDAEFDELKTFINENKLKPVKLLNTHLHLDHIFGNRFVLDEYGLKTHAAREEEMNLLSAVQYAAMFGLNMPEPPDVGTFISGGQELKVGKILLHCLFVPGHTAGSIAFYCREENFVLTGDALFAGSIGRSDLPGGNHDTLLTSIKNNLLSLPDDIVVYPGHGTETRIGVERKTNPFLT
ncbi:MAG: MBL fold metallo-hydrolase [Bacteroidales bacterium]|nr:MBL fold metallo-hydrolase [Bacteroidales bacterium]